MAGLSVEFPAVIDPVTLTWAKNFLRVDDITDDDDLIASLISAATILCEVYCRRSFIQKGFLLTLDSFPYFTDTMLSQMAYPPSYYSLPRYSTTLWNYSQMIKVFRPPLISVDRITYMDSTKAAFEDLVPQPIPWYPQTAYTAGQQVADYNGNIETCTFPGTSGTSTPDFSTIVGNSVGESGYNPTQNYLLAIVNASFENPPQTPGSGIYTPTAPPGWTLGGAGSGGVLSPTSTEFPLLPSSSSQVGWLGAGSKFEQILSEIIAAGAYHVLTLFCGSRSDIPGTSRVSLIDQNGNVLASVTPQLTNGSLVEVTLAWTATAAAAGNQLGIRLECLTGQAQFDELILTDTRAPIALTWRNDGPLPQGEFGAYIVDNISEPGRIFPGIHSPTGGPVAGYWPSVLYVPNAVQIHYTAGYGSTIASVPHNVKAAIMMLVADMYENRAPAKDTDEEQIPKHVRQLLWPSRVLDFAQTRG